MKSLVNRKGIIFINYEILFENSYFNIFNMLSWNCYYVFIK